jgi:hypothetical protein
MIKEMIDSGLETGIDILSLDECELAGRAKRSRIAGAWGTFEEDCILEKEIWDGMRSSEKTTSLICECSRSDVPNLFDGTKHLQTRAEVPQVMGRSRAIPP